MIKTRYRCHSQKKRKTWTLEEQQLKFISFILRDFPIVRALKYDSYITQKYLHFFPVSPRHDKVNKYSC